MNTIFLSYRRDDTADDARKVYESLTERFGDEVVFLDVENIEYGDDFVDEITGALETAAYVLIAIGPKWLLLTDEAGNSRLEDPDDMVRLEIKSALDTKKKIVPMMFGGTKMPKPRELPKDIAPLVRRNGIDIRPEPDFDTDVADLMAGLKKDRILAGRVPVVFRLGLMARNIGFGGGIGWGLSSIIPAFFVDKALAFLVFPLAGLLAGFGGGAVVGWLTGLLIRYRSPPLVGRKLIRIGVLWSFFLIGSAIFSGVIGYDMITGSPSDSPDVSDLNLLEAFVMAIVIAIFTMLFMLIAMMVTIIIGFMIGSAIAAAFFARLFRMRSDQISVWRGFAIGLVWMLGGLLTAVLYVAVIGLLSP
jgi:hypothetical protein